MNRKFWLCLIIIAMSSIYPAFAVVPLQDFNGAAALNARINLIKAAEAFLGTPYKYAGIDNRGMDCSGLVFASFRDSLRISVPRTSTGLFVWAERIPDSELKPGDLVFFATGSNSAVTHVGIYAGNGRFIHSASAGPRTGVMYSRLDESYWNRTYTGAGRAIPWDNGTEAALAETAWSGTAWADTAEAADTVNPGRGSGTGNLIRTNERKASWAATNGFFTGGGLAWTLGILPGSSPPIRGFAGQLKAGYKINNIQIALELRPQTDSVLGTGRLPLTLCVGNDKFQVFAGPVFILGESDEAAYEPAFSAIGEAGISWALKPIELGQGSLSIFAETVWQPYSRNDSGEGDFSATLSANIRASIGLRYLFLLR